MTRWSHPLATVLFFLAAGCSFETELPKGNPPARCNPQTEELRNGVCVAKTTTTTESILNTPQTPNTTIKLDPVPVVDMPDGVTRPTNTEGQATTGGGPSDTVRGVAGGLGQMVGVIRENNSGEAQEEGETEGN